MKYYSRRLVRPNDLNAAETLFGGQLLSWIDEEAAIYSICQMKVERVVTKFISEIDFESAARLGDILEIGLEVIAIGKTSLTLRCKVRNKNTSEAVLSIRNIVFVSVNEFGRPIRHAYSDRRLTLAEQMESGANLREPLVTRMAG